MRARRTAYRSAAMRLQVPIVEMPVVTDAEKEAAMEARNFADGQHSILDVRNAISAELGPIALDDVTRFFRDAETAGTHVIAVR